MVFVKVRETYDLNTVQNKITAIGIHTPKADIIQKNYPGLLMQCKSYRPVSCDVRVACASMLPADPLQVSTASGDIAPEDLFNPILYKACTNQGMSQIEARINAFNHNGAASPQSDVNGSSAQVDNDSLTSLTDEFNLYYGMLSDTHQWRHASPQSGFSMNGLKPLVYEMLYSNADNCANVTSVSSTSIGNYAFPGTSGGVYVDSTAVFKGHAKPMPFINCTSYTYNTTSGSSAASGFPNVPANASVFTPAPTVYVGCIIVPPSRLHQLFYRMVVEWTIEFSGIRSVGEITDWLGLASLGSSTHYMSYDYSSAKAAVGVEDETLVNDTEMVSSNVEINKVM